MSDLNSISTDELEYRLRQVIEELDSYFKQVGPILEKIDRRRKEFYILEKELRKRNGK